MATETAIHRVAEHVSQASLQEYVAQHIADALLKSGVAALKNKDFEKALRIFSRLSEEREHNFLIELGKVLAFNGLGQWEQSIRTLRGMLGLGDDKEVLLLIGSYQQGLGQYDDALDTFDQVIEQWPDDADVWVFRSPSLVSLGRVQESIESLEKCYVRRSRCSNSGIWSLYFAAALSSLVAGVEGIKQQWLPLVEASANTFIRWRGRARRDKQQAAFREAEEAMKKLLTAMEPEPYEEFLLTVRLLSIRDPFKGWQALTREIGKVWPEGVSAVDAIREQRD